MQLGDLRNRHIQKLFLSCRILSKFCTILTLGEYKKRRQRCRAGFLKTIPGHPLLIKCAIMEKLFDVMNDAVRN